MYFSNSLKVLCHFALVILFLLSVLLNNASADEKSTNCRSFKINYERNTFTKDGKDFRYISGSFHYFRSVKEHWNDIFQKFRLAGLNAVQT